ncbi:DUF2277 domain-containing protein [Saccharopolyspora sp. 6M]|nr:DUF2277 domain-containing protein [Saccharopolyspora sp. 6T]MCA1224826.1 DUF2277 domain-containing protein [Saccharopolyspora sp. 6M]
MAPGGAGGPLTEVIDEVLARAARSPLGALLAAAVRRRGSPDGCRRAEDDGGMCRSIKTLRPPYAEQVTEQDVRAAALQYVRKISGFRAPAAHNAAAFDRAVDEVERATAALLESLEVRGSRS